MELGTPLFVQVLMYHICLLISSKFFSLKNYPQQRWTHVIANPYKVSQDMEHSPLFLKSIVFIGESALNFMYFKMLVSYCSHRSHLKNWLGKKEN